MRIHQILFLFALLFLSGMIYWGMGQESQFLNDNHLLTKNTPNLGVNERVTNSIQELTPHEQIFIDGNDDFKTQAIAGAWRGDGTVNDPIVIDSLNITYLSSFDALIFIGNTDVHFQITNFF